MARGLVLHRAFRRANVAPDLSTPLHYADCPSSTGEPTHIHVKHEEKCHVSDMFQMGIYAAMPRLVSYQSCRNSMNLAPYERRFAYPSSALCRSLLIAQQSCDHRTALSSSTSHLLQAPSPLLARSRAFHDAGPIAHFTRSRCVGIASFFGLDGTILNGTCFRRLHFSFVNVTSLIAPPLNPPSLISTSLTAPPSVITHPSTIPIQIPPRTTNPWILVLLLPRYPLTIPRAHREKRTHTLIPLLPPPHKPPLPSTARACTLALRDLARCVTISSTSAGCFEG